MYVRETSGHMPKKKHTHNIRLTAKKVKNKLPKIPHVKKESGKGLLTYCHIGSVQEFY